MSGATNAYDGFQKAAKQAAGVAEANMQAMSTQALRVAQLPTAKAKRAA